ncbi:O-methyltransferase [Obba rivulosa]|uniref:O-methyltransferase n=1 Tax=Obba rivulosa TaxID=1052685 RepID=A0A8E2AHU6_9APHY|nr:O-methyltransferase [Obba rivulosa]
MSTIKALADIISNGVASIQAACDSRNVSFPSLDEPFTPQSNAVRQEIYSDIIPIIAAAHQLIATLQAPPAYAIEKATSYLIAPSVSAVLAGNVVEILRDAGPQGLHVNVIAAENNMDGRKLARVLRFLANHHIFKEVTPDVFTNTSISSTLDTGKPLNELLQNTQEKYDNTQGFAALVGHLTDESLKSAAYLSDTLTDPRTASSYEPTESAFNRAFGTPNGMFEWYEQPENAFRLRRFNAGMRATAGETSEVLEGFEWDQLPKNSIVVDVGGGIGAMTKHLADNHKQLRYIVQDRAATIEGAVKVWETERPEAIKSGLVSLQVQDFFEEQPVTNASVFLLRAVVHDWPEHYAKKILQRLRPAATSTTKLILIEHIVRYSCRSEGQFKDIPGADEPEAPEPLLPNYGISGGREYVVDLQMMNLLNAQERTIPQFMELLRSAGWKLDRVIRSPSDRFALLVASPL